MNFFMSPESSSLDGVRVITCEKPKRSAWSAGLKLGPKLYSHSAETRAYIGAGNTGKIRSDEHRSSLSAVKCCRIVSVETRLKLSAANRGKILSAETRNKIGAAHRGRSVKGEIMTPWGKYYSVNMAKDCGIMLGVKNSDRKINLGLKTDTKNYYYIKETK